MLLYIQFFRPGARNQPVVTAVAGAKKESTINVVHGSEEAMKEEIEEGYWGSTRTLY